MYQIFYSFGYGNLLIFEDRSRKMIEGMMVVIAAVSNNTAAIVSILFETDLSAKPATFRINGIDQSDFFF